MQPQTTLRGVDASRAADLDAITELHMDLLDFGPMAGLGPEFIREVCYRLHLEDGLLQAALYEVDGRPAGFIAYTDRSITFHRASLGGHFLFVARTVLRSVLRDPRRLGALIRTLRVVRSRRHEQRQGRDPLGEVVCVAVRPEYLAPDFVRRTRVRVSEILVRHAMDRLRRAGVARMRMLVDEDNKAPLFLYHRLGARCEKYDYAGVPTLQVWFDLQLSGQDE